MGLPALLVPLGIIRMYAVGAVKIAVPVITPVGTGSPPAKNVVLARLSVGRHFQLVPTAGSGLMV